MALIEGLDVEHRGSGPDLVILHSLLADRSAFDRVAPLLSKKRRLWLVNLPGYGDSPPDGTSVEDYADRIAALIRNLKLENADVLGNGFGGFIAVALTARHGILVRRLIAAPALVAFPEPAKQPLRGLAERVAREGMSGALDVAIRRMFPERFIAANPSVVDERKQALMKADPRCFSTACLALAALDLSPVLSNIKSETLVVAGSEDATTPPALARQLAGKIRNAKFLELQGCGHCPQIENPDLFVRTVEDFL
jgi:3-oxoadipate enol-lactonase